MGELPDRVTRHLDEPLAAQLSEALGRVVTGVTAAVGEQLAGIHLVGSFALGAGDAHSDVDVVVRTHAALEPPRAVALRALHRELPSSPGPWLRHLEAGYATAEQLAGPPGAGADWLYVDNGSCELVRSRHDDTWTTRWILAHAAVTLRGEDAADSVRIPTADEMRSAARAEALRRREALRRDPAILADAWGQTYVVTLFARLLRTASEGDVLSKADALRWAAERSDGVARALLERAIHDRPDPWRRVGRRADAELELAMPDFVEELAERIAASPGTHA